MLPVTRSLGVSVRRLLRSLFLRRRLERDVDEEMQFHIDLSTEAHVSSGATRAEAEQRARREFGNRTRVTDAARDIRRATSLEHLASDLRNGWRTAHRAPLFALTAIVVLGLGIGSTTTMYSISHGIQRDLPVEAPERLVHVAAMNRARGIPESRINAWEFHAVASAQRSLETLAAVRTSDFHVGDPDRFAQRWHGASITPEVFPALRVAPVMGRGFSPGDAQPGAPAVVIIGTSLWRSSFDADRAVLGRTIRVNGELRTIIGVMGEGFTFPRNEELWIPEQPATAPPPDGPRSWIAFGRLRDGVSVERARTELATIDAQLTREFGEREVDRQVMLRPFREQQFSRKVRPTFTGMLLVVSFVLLIACANVAGMLLANGAARAREMAVRSALGASAMRLRVQLLGEGLMLAIGGGLLGLALASIGVSTFNAIAGFELSFGMRVALDAPVLGWSMLLVLGSALLAGLAPARMAARIAVGDVLKTSARGSSGYRVGRLHRALVGFEVALSVALLVVTALMVQGVWLNQGSLATPRTGELHVTQLELRADAYPTPAERLRFFTELEQSLSARPEIRAVSLSSALPGIDGDGVPFEVGGQQGFDVAGTAGQGTRPRVPLTSVNPGFFTTFGANMVEGRAFTANDEARATAVAIVNRRLVQKYFSDASPLGKRIRLSPSDTTSPWRTIVGVVNDVERRPITAPELGMVYIPVAQVADAAVNVTLRSTADAALVARLATDVVRGIDPEVTVVSTSTVDALLARAQATERLFGGLFLFFALSALLLASVGLGSMVALSVQQRRLEMGIRRALGAHVGEVLGVVLRGGLVQVVLGIVVGLPMASLLSRPLASALMGADAGDWRPYVVAGSTLLVSAIAAVWLPTRRALRITPAEVLRAE